MLRLQFPDKSWGDIRRAAPFRYSQIYEVDRERRRLQICGPQPGGIEIPPHPLPQLADAEGLDTISKLFLDAMINRF
jgi:hypothetical protein